MSRQTKEVLLCNLAALFFFVVYSFTVSPSFYWRMQNNDYDLPSLEQNALFYLPLPADVPLEPTYPDSLIQDGEILQHLSQDEVNAFAPLEPVVYTADNLIFDEVLHEYRLLQRDQEGRLSFIVSDPLRYTYFVDTTQQVSYPSFDIQTSIQTARSVGLLDHVQVELDPDSPIFSLVLPRAYFDEPRAFKTPIVIQLDTDVLAAQVSAFQSHGQKVERHPFHFSAEVSLSEPTPVLFLAPTSTHWQLFAGETPIETESLGSFLTTELPAGDYDLTLSYSRLHYVIGLLIVVFVLDVFCLVEWAKRPRQMQSFTREPSPLADVSDVIEKVQP